MSFHLQLAAPFTAAEAPAACLHYQRRRPTTSQLCSAASISFPFRPVFFTARKLTSSSSSPLRCFAGLSPELKSGLDKVVNSNKVILFMKGSKDFPECGFSNTVVQILKSLNVPFESINILENEMLRQGLKEYSSWPTFPQLYIDGEFFGGCDITVDGKQPGNGHGRVVVRILDLMNNSETEAYKSGELQEVLEKAMCS